MLEETSEGNWDGLPLISPDTYKPLTEKQLAEAKAAVVGNKPLADLLNYLSDYETYGPYQAGATPDDWEKVVMTCAHIKPKLPKPTAGMEHLIRAVDENGPQLPPEFFNLTDKAYYLWDLDACLELVYGSALCHEHTGTYMGGPNGFKWVVLLLVHLYSCGTKTCNGLGPVYDGEYAEWPETGTTELEEAIKYAQDRLDKSVKKLHKTSQQRARGMASRDETRPELGRWTEEDVLEYVIDAESDEWTQQNLIVTSGLEHHRTGPTAPQQADSPQKRPLGTSEDDDDILLEEDGESHASEQAPRKKLKFT
ncbi:hypothetical protein FRC07_008751 [Ceratobasidium sp. 392]|nr:hypothetical protein FRC07_008751 [Ceratobasidium sp. 392]